MRRGAPVDPAERRRRDSLRGRRAYEALRARFERQVDPDGTLPPDERARRAELARQAHFRELGRRGGKSTAKAKTAVQSGAQPPVKAATGRRAARVLAPDDWAHLWEQPELRAVLAARDVGAVYRALQDFGVAQRQIAQLTGQSQSEVSAILGGRQVR